MCVCARAHARMRLALATGSLFFMTSMKASQHACLMAALVAVPGRSWEAAQGVQTPLWMVYDDSV